MPKLVMKGACTVDVYSISGKAGISLYLAFIDNLTVGS